MPLFPLLWFLGIFYHLFHVLSNDGIISLRDDQADGIVRTSKLVGLAAGGYTSAMAPQGDIHLETRWQGFPEESYFWILGLTLLSHGTGQVTPLQRTGTPFHSHATSCHRHQTPASWGSTSSPVCSSWLFISPAGPVHQQQCRGHADIWGLAICSLCLHWYSHGDVGFLEGQDAEWLQGAGDPCLQEFWWLYATLLRVSYGPRGSYVATTWRYVVLRSRYVGITWHYVSCYVAVTWELRGGYGLYEGLTWRVRGYPVALRQLRGPYEARGLRGVYGAVKYLFLN